jgi:hypothetical protein
MSPTTLILVNFRCVMTTPVCRQADLWPEAAGGISILIVGTHLYVQDTIQPRELWIVNGE